MDGQKWFKFYGQDWMTDLKIIQMPMHDRLCYISLLCLASASDEQGIVKNCNEDSLIALSHIPCIETADHNPFEMARGCLKRFETLGMVTVTENGDVEIKAFIKRQSRFSESYERVKKHRMKRSETERNATVKRNDNARVDKIRVDKNKLTTTLCEDTSQNKEVAEIIDLFKKTLAPSLSFGNKTQRKAVEEMLKKWSFEKLKGMAERVIAVQGKPYAPRASTPHAMWTKIGDFVSYFQSQNAGGDDNKNKIATV